MLASKTLSNIREKILELLTDVFNKKIHIGDLFCLPIKAWFHILKNKTFSHA